MDKLLTSLFLLSIMLTLASSSSASFNHVWQNGDNMRSMTSVDFAGNDLSSNLLLPIKATTNPPRRRRRNRNPPRTYGNDEDLSFGTTQRRRRNVHGVLNAVSWGMLMPMGAIYARYLKVFKSATSPAWFYVHIACQATAYAVGVVGWGIGLKLGSDSPGIKYNTHRNIGITLFCLGTLQVLAMIWRPKQEHKFRFYWNIYHYVVGYTVIILSIINVFEGFDALDGQKNWKRAYIGVIVCLGVIAISLEVFSWLIVTKRKRALVSENSQNGANNVNGSETMSKNEQVV